MQFKYKTKGTCSRAIILDVEGDTINSVEFIGGCKGNTQGVAALVAGKNVDEIIGLLKGIECRGNTSCPDQLARALEYYKTELR